jgi:hypothetical protein
MSALAVSPPESPWIQHVMDVKRKYGLKSLHDAIKKAKMSWKKALLP